MERLILNEVDRNGMSELDVHLLAKEVFLVMASLSDVDDIVDAIELCENLFMDDSFLQHSYIEYFDDSIKLYQMSGVELVEFKNI